MEQFNPALAQRLLEENALQLENIGLQIIEKRNNLIVKEAEYMDARAESAKKRLVEYSATAAQKWIDIDVVEQRKAFHKTEHELKNLIQQKQILLEGNNNLKVQINLWRMEAGNLNLMSGGREKPQRMA